MSRPPNPATAPLPDDIAPPAAPAALAERALDDIEQAIAEGAAEAEQADTTLKASRRARTAEAIRYPLQPWSGLSVFLDDGRVEIDSNVWSSARAALSRKTVLVAGSDQGDLHWGVIASSIETAKLDAVDPQVYLATTLTRLVQDHPTRRIDNLMPRACTDPVA